MSASMAEVLAGHGLLSSGRTGTYACSNPECGWELRYRARMDDLKRGVDVVAREFATHQAGVLAANGYGKLEDAWDEGYTTGNAHNGRRDANPFRRPECPEQR